MESRGWALGLLVLAGAGCIGGSGPGGISEPAQPPAVVSILDAPGTGRPARTDLAELFQPAFHQALPGSESAPQRTTYRFRVRVARGGSRLRATFRAGDGPLSLFLARVARSGPDGQPEAPAAELTFSRAPGFTVGPRERMTSDPLRLDLQRGEELWITFEAEGALAAGRAEVFPEAFSAPGSHADAPGPFGTRHPWGAGLSTLEVEGRFQRAFVVLGETLSLGGSLIKDYRRTWPAVAQRLLRLPVVVSAIEGQSIQEALRRVDDEVRPLAGLTDCVVFLGQPELSSLEAGRIQLQLSDLFSRLSTMCRVYGATLPPPGDGGAPEAERTRVQVNEWLRRHAPLSGLLDLEEAITDPRNPRTLLPGLTVSGRLTDLAHQLLGHQAARALARAPLGVVPDVSGLLTFRATHVELRYDFKAVDRAGTAYATRVDESHRRVWASDDSGRTWTARGQHPASAAFLQIATLSDGVLLADTQLRGLHTVARSTDQGATWEDVLPLDGYQMLQPHSVAELGGEVFLAEYQVDTLEAPIRVWVSKDRGATWRVRYTFQGRRHCHALIADPAKKALWALMGDRFGGLLRSTDRGFSWTPVVDGPPGVAVDAVVTPEGLLLGLDNLFLPDRPVIKRVNPDDSVTVLAPLPGPSYSIVRLPSGGYALGTTREVDGDVYPPGDESAHVFASADGERWQEVFDIPRGLRDEYGRADVRWSLPTGEVALELINARSFGHLGRGYVLLEPTVH